jgi:hypothetical protein
MFTTGLESVHSSSYSSADRTFGKVTGYVMSGNVSNLGRERFFFWWGETYVTRYYGHFWPIVQPQMIDESDCGAIGGMKIGRGSQCTLRKPAPAPFCPPQIPLDQTRARTQAAAVGSQRLTA